MPEIKDALIAKDIQMMNERMKARPSVIVRADAESKGVEPDKLLEHMDSLCKGVADMGSKLDAMHERLEALEGKKDKRRKDDGEEHREVAGSPETRQPDDDDEEELKGVGTQNTAGSRTEDDDDEHRRDKRHHRHDSDRRALGYLSPDHERRERLTEVQVFFEPAYRAIGDEGAPRPLSGERPEAYKRRCAKGLQRYSKAWREVPLAGLFDQGLNIASDQIRADALEEGRRPTQVSPGVLREIRRDSDAGHRISEFYGEASAWMSQLPFGIPPKRVVGFQKDGRALHQN
jgi:hypothetical protein